MNTPDQENQYTFGLYDSVTREKVNFKNRYGITLTGDLYLPKNYEKGIAALAIAGPYGGVKEQASGLYANEFAARGFAALAFDPSFTGESSGEPKGIGSPEIFTEDFSAAIDYLGLHQAVNKNKVGIMGICGFGGFGLNAAAVDKRVKAVAVTSMYDISRWYAKGYFDSVIPEQRTEMLEQLGQQRWNDAESGTPSYNTQGLPTPDRLSGQEPEFVQSYVDYYKTERGFHPRSINSNGAWTVTTPLSFMNMPILSYINEISPRPVLIIAGENAHSLYFSQAAFEHASEPKELMIIPNAVHVDLYDKITVIPFEKLATYFNENLR